MYGIAARATRLSVVLAVLGSSWGQVIGSNRQYILDASYTVTIPGIAIFVTVLAISLVGDGLNDALNPKLRQR